MKEALSTYPMPYIDILKRLILMVLAAKYIVSRQCDLPMPQRYPEADPATIIPFVIATILFAIRMVAKSLRLGGGWGPDDYTIIAAYVRIYLLEPES